MGANSKENIARVVPVDVSSEDFEPSGRFFIRSGAGGVIRYCPSNNADDEYIEKTVDASAVFNDPEYCRKIFKEGTTATEIYAGFGF
jgi:hypothetical protein